MSLIKDFLISSPEKKVGKNLSLSSEKEIVDGACLSCSHLNECIWQANNKIYCEHYL